MGLGSYYGGTLTVKPNGERLKALRDSLPQKTSQPKVEAQTGISRGQLTRYETGKPASTKDIKRLAQFYGVEAAELLAPEGLDMCNEILEEMCMFTNKRVVVDTNGNESSTVVKGFDWGATPATVEEVEQTIQSSDENTKI